VGTHFNKTLKGIEDKDYVRWALSTHPDLAVVADNDLEIKLSS
jgi:hypothetical protein